MLLSALPSRGPFNIGAQVGGLKICPAIRNVYGERPQSTFAAERFRLLAPNSCGTVFSTIQARLQTALGGESSLEVVARVMKKVRTGPPYGILPVQTISTLGLMSSADTIRLQDVSVVLTTALKVEEGIATGALKQKLSTLARQPMTLFPTSLGAQACKVTEAAITGQCALPTATGARTSSVAAATTTTSSRAATSSSAKSSAPGEVPLQYAPLKVDLQLLRSPNDSIRGRGLDGTAYYNNIALYRVTVTNPTGSPSIPAGRLDLTASTFGKYSFVLTQIQNSYTTQGCTLVYGQLRNDGGRDSTLKCTTPPLAGGQSSSAISMSSSSSSSSPPVSFSLSLSVTCCCSCATTGSSRAAVSGWAMMVDATLPHVG
jgi:hypothetical protein